MMSFSADSVMADGVFNSNAHEVELKRKMRDISSRSFLVADSSKFCRESLYKVFDLDNFEAELSAQGAHALRGVPRGAAPKGGVRPQHHEAHAERLVETAGEVFGGDFRHFASESEGDHPIGPGRPEQLHAVFEGSEVAGGNVRAEHGDGVGVEGYDARRERALAGLIAQAGEERLVAAMDAIEHPDRQRGLGPRCSSRQLGACERGDGHT